MIVCGSYEGGLHGWDEAWALRFSFVAHTGCVRTVAVLKSKKLLVSGGDDETMRIFSLKSLKQIGEAACSSTVTSLAFCGEGHVLSACADGTIKVWRLADWACVHVLGGHKGSVPSVASHPSGRMALSTGVDRTLRLWDLTAGRCAFITRTKGAASLARWSADGGRFLAAIGGLVQVRDVTKSASETVVAVDHDTRVLDALFLDAETFVTADAAGVLRVWTVGGERAWLRRRPDGARVKALALAGDALVAATSDGVVETWRIRELGDADDPPEATAVVSTRLTCIAECVTEPGGRRRSPAEAATAAAAVSSEADSASGPEQKEKKQLKLPRKAAAAAAATEQQKGSATERRRMRLKAKIRDKNNKRRRI
ncbi:hypothetical protein CTAYLR_007088 [Chrysophaeum taylorii]|uniref:P21-activated protein kinase-interacting protein 1-like n=1 Tax=Chrysophaeum taylorii TaxID=2483200 RepID=A0AAD7ULV2_9STRA|nr:hypothetical protein CTAYLR_007088 [Chrysophaeum taylorii]